MSLDCDLKVPVVRLNLGRFNDIQHFARVKRARKSTVSTLFAFGKEKARMATSSFLVKLLLESGPVASPLEQVWLLALTR